MKCLYIAQCVVIIKQNRVDPHSGCFQGNIDLECHRRTIINVNRKQYGKIHRDSYRL